jgi:hypothetical protein
MSEIVFELVWNAVEVGIGADTWPTARGTGVHGTARRRAVARTPARCLASVAEAISAVRAVVETVIRAVAHAVADGNSVGGAAEKTEKEEEGGNSGE